MNITNKLNLSIPTYRMDKVNKAINRMNNLISNDLPEIKLSIIGKEIKPIEFIHKMDGTRWTEIRYISFTNIQVESYGIIGFNGWSVLGKLENIYDYEKPMITTIMGKELPEYYKLLSKEQLVCEHCNKNIITRIKYFILYNQEIDTYQMVGSSCLKEFLGVDPEKWLQYFQIVLDTSISDNIADDEEFKLSKEYYVNLDELLILGMYVINQKGFYVSFTQSDDDNLPTSVVVNHLLNSFDQFGIINEYQEKYANDIRLIKEWIINYTGTLDLILNAKQFIEKGKVHYKYINRAIALLPFYFKEKKNKQNKISNYYGNIKDKIVNLAVEIIGLYTYPSNYGYVTIIIMDDHNGHIFKWNCTSNSINELENGDIIQISGTIKEHSEYRGIKQTILTRCKVNII